MPAPRGALDGLGLGADELYRLLVANLPQAAVYLYDADLRFVLAEGAAMREVGLAPEDVVGRTLADVAAPESLAALEPAYRAALAGEEVDFEHPGEGTGRWYRVRVLPVRDTAGQVVGGLVVTDDVTEQRAARLDVARSRQQWQQLFHEAPVGMWLAEPGPDGAVLDVNDALCALLELSREELLASRKVDLVQPDDPERFHAALATMTDGRRSAVLERRVLLADGGERWLSMTASLVETPDGPRALAHFVDMTAAKQAEQELRAATEFRDAVLRVIPDVVHVAEADLGNHVWTSRELGHELGYTDAELADVDDLGLELVHPGDVPLLLDGLRRVAAAADGEVVHVRHRAKGADGSLRWLDRRKTPFRRRPDGTLEQYLSVVRDVTDEVAAEAALRTAHAFQEAVLATSPDVVSVFDLDAGQTVWASRTLGDLMGWDLQEVRRLQAGGLTGLVHPDDIAAVQASLAEAAAAGDGVVVQGTARLRNADGTWHVAARRSTPFLRDAAGRVQQVLTVTRDITDQVTASTELEEVRAFQQAVIATAPDLILVMDAAGDRPVWTSRELDELLGWSAVEVSELGEQPFDRLVHPDDLASLKDRVATVLAAPDGSVVHAQYRARHRDGDYRWLNRRMTPFARDASGAVTQYLTTVRDVTDVVEAEHRLQHAALHDPLTALPNRRLVADRLRTALAGTARGGRLAALYLDLDGFKRINDVHGHAAGDTVLRETAQRLLHVLRQGDTVGRMGGDEFVVLVHPAPGERLEPLAEQVAERLRVELSRPVAHAGLLHAVTASVGIAYAGAGDDADAVLRDADSAMYRAKASGKDRTAVFDEDEQAQAREHGRVEAALRQALAEDRVEAFYQPLLRAATGRVEAVEALLRVRGADGRFLDAATAVAVAERCGLMPELGAALLRRACAQAVAWDDGLLVSVNLGVREAVGPGLAARVRAALDATGLPAEQLVLELPEAVLAAAPGGTLSDLEQLRAAGVGLAVDGFGSATASLHHLAALPLTWVKVARELTAGLPGDEVSRTLVRATLALARDLGWDCVVEGVESREQLAWLGTEPHLLTQGFLLGAPVPAPDLGR